VAGVERAIASRISAMAAGTITPPVVFTGGVARVGRMDAALAEALGQSMALPQGPEFTGALGAALLAMDRGEK
jgi:activator of 2-hydroxyglutaryl-CoA dehydratase